MNTILLVIPLAILSGYFWRMGGSGIYSRYWRRIGIAILLTISCYLQTFNLWSLLVFPLAYSSSCLGYGIPDSGDDGSSIARFWLMIGYRLGIVSIPERILQFAVRASVGLAYSMSYLVLGFLKGNILGAIIGMVGLTLTIPLICNYEWDVVKEERLIGVVILLWTLVI